MMLSRRFALLGSLIVVVAIAFAVRPVRSILADRAADARVQRRADLVCPRWPQAAGATANAAIGSPGGQVFISHGSRRQVSILELASGRITRLAAGIDDPHEVAVSPDGRLGVAADFGTNLGAYRFDGRRLAVFDLAEKRLLRVIDLGDHRGPHDIHFLPGSASRAVVTTQTTRNVVEVDIVRGEVLGATATDADGSHTLAITGDGRFGFVANEADGTVSRMDLRDRVLLGKLVVGPAPVEGVAVTPDGQEVWVGARGTEEVRVIDAMTGARLASLDNFVVPDRIAIDPAGRLVVITDWACEQVRVVDRESRRVLGSIDGLGGAGVAKILPDGRTAIVAMLPEGAVAVVDLEARRVVARHELGIRLDAAAWGPDPAGAARPAR